MIDAKADIVQGIADLMRNASRELPDRRKMLRLPEPLFKFPVVTQLTDHEVEALGEIADLVLAVHGKVLVQFRRPLSLLLPPRDGIRSV